MASSQKGFNLESSQGVIGNYQFECFNGIFIKIISDFHQTSSHNPSHSTARQPLAELPRAAELNLISNTNKECEKMKDKRIK